MRLISLKTPMYVLSYDIWGLFLIVIFAVKLRIELSNDFRTYSCLRCITIFEFVFWGLNYSTAFFSRVEFNLIIQAWTVKKVVMTKIL